MYLPIRQKKKLVIIKCVYTTHTEKEEDTTRKKNVLGDI